MTQPPDPPDETPLQRALRLKNAALAAKKPAREAKLRQGSAAAPTGKSKPWMTR